MNGDSKGMITREHRLDLRMDSPDIVIRTGILVYTVSIKFDVSESFLFELSRDYGLSKLLAFQFCSSDTAVDLRINRRVYVEAH
jgi:hypothetical protein